MPSRPSPANPKGFDVSELPEGWTRAGRGQAPHENPGPVTQPSFTVTRAPAAATPS